MLAGLSALGSCSGDFGVWLQPCKFLQSNSCDVFQVTFPGLMSSLSDEHVVCSFLLVKGAGGECLGFWHKLSLMSLSLGRDLPDELASNWEA